MRKTYIPTNLTGCLMFRLNRELGDLLDDANLGTLLFKPD
jgi:hypothetical protein